MYGAIDRMVFRSVVLSAIATLFSQPVLAGQIYKWVDKNGQVHYTQTPPPPSSNEKEEKKVEVKKMSTSTLVVTKQGEYEYCGDMRLPGPYYDEKTQLRTLEDSTRLWQDSLRQMEASFYSVRSQLENYESQQSSSSYRSSTADSYADQSRRNTARQIMQYRCAIDWSERKRSELSDVKREISHDVRRAESEYQLALETAQKECGYEPSNFNDPRYQTMMSQWQDCMSRHRSTIRSRKATLERAKAQLSQTR